MLRLRLNTEPAWIELLPGVRIRVRPFTTAVVHAAQADIEALGCSPEEIEASRGELFTAAAARVAILEWEGVGDEEGRPVPVTPGNINALMAEYPAYAAFQRLYVVPRTEMDAEGNASPLSPRGGSARARDTVPAAKPAARNARKPKTRP